MKKGSHVQQFSYNFLTKIPLYCKWIVDGSYTERQSSIHREALGDPDNLNGEEVSSFLLLFSF